MSRSHSQTFLGGNECQDFQSSPVTQTCWEPQLNILTQELSNEMQNPSTTLQR